MDERDQEEPIFKILNSNNEIVFAVYEQGVRIYVGSEPEEKGKGNRSGFAIGGLTGFKADENEKDYFSVSRERTQVLFDDQGKGNRSGFAIGGLTGLKSDDDDKEYLSVAREHTRVLFDDETKGNRSGFAIGGLTGFKSDPTDLLTVNFDTTTIYTTLQATGNVDILGNIYTGGTISTQVTYNGYTLRNHQD